MKSNVYQSGINAYYNEFYIEMGLNNINETINLFNKLIRDDNISFNEYVDIINRVYKVEISNNDLLKISSIILGDTSKSVIINTDMEYNVTKRLEFAGEFEYREETRDLYLKIAFVNDGNIDFSHKYTSSEINKMINDRKIVLLDFVVDDDEDDYQIREEFGLYPMSNIVLNNFTNLKSLRKEYVPHITTFLKGYFTIDKLKSDLDDYLDITKRKIIMVENYITNIQNNYSIKVTKFDDIMKECKKIKKRK